MRMEKFLHDVWFNRLFDSNQSTVQGESVEIIDVGIANTNAGADVFNAKVKIGGTLWAGDIEFHSIASDWNKHSHHTDRAYNSVILHVVLVSDTDVLRENGTLVPQIILKYPEDIDKQMESIKNPFIPCANTIVPHPKEAYKEAFDKLIRQRLDNRFSIIDNLLNQTSNDWEEAFYVTTARSFGFGTNAEVFELLAKNLPYKIISKHKDNILQIESLIFGVAGFLEMDLEDSYHKSLQKEYAFLSAKYQLKNLEKSQWKFLRLRPMNFPTIRLAQFANLLYSSNNLFSKVMEFKEYDKIVKLYSVGVSEYWTNHYVFAKESNPREKKISKDSIKIIITNSIVPFLYAYGIKFGFPEFIERSFDILQSMPKEKNYITAGFENLGIEIDSALQSQALIELKTNYCNPKKCFLCKNKLVIF